MFLTIINPQTHQYTNLFSDEVNNLIKNGYNVKDILMLSKIIPHYYNRENIFTNDLLINYMTHLELKDSMSLCLIDKHAQTLINSKYLWKVKIETLIMKGYKFRDDYTLDNYKKCIYANKCIKQHADGMKNYSVMFTFNPKDDLSKITGNGKNYNINKYDSQELIINNNTIQFFYSTNGESFKLNPLKLSEKTLKMCLYNIFYYFPDVKITYGSIYL